MLDEIAELVGIVVIGRNEGKRLPFCFESMDHLGCHKVYVDSGSIDNSVSIAALNNIYVVELDRSKAFSAARARNEGFDALLQLNPNIKFVHFIDGDCELDRNWLPEALQAFKHNSKIAVVCGRLREKFRNTSVYMRLCDMDWYRPPGRVDSCGGIATFRRTVFEDNDGFNSSLIAGEEPELCSRIRSSELEILCLNVEMGTHDSGMVSFSQWWTRCVKVGFGYMSGSNWGGWKKQYKSSVFWGLLLPLFILMTLTSTSFLSLLLLALYPVQIYRVFKGVKGDNLSKRDCFVYAFYCILSKFPESQGLLLFYIKKITARHVMIQYK